MNIAYLLTRSDTVGGSHVHVTDLAKGVIAAGHTATVLAGGEGPFHDHLKEHGVPFYPLRYLRRSINPVHDFNAYRELADAIQKFRPSLVASHSAKTSWMARLLNSATGIPCVMTVHCWSFSSALPASQRLTYLLAERAISHLPAEVITVSNHDRDLARRLKVAQGCRLTTVHNGIPDVDPALRACAAANPPTLISVARFDAPKDHETLLSALARIRHLPWNLTLVGDGPRMGRVREMAARLDLSGRIWFAGFRTDVAALLARSQLFVLLSDSEGFPVSILEAMRAALPVIASNVGGISEAISHRRNGYLLPPRNVQQTAETLARLIVSPDERLAVGLAAREEYRTRFTFECMLEKTLPVYRSAMKSEHRPVKLALHAGERS